MDIATFVEQFADLFIETDTSELTAETKFRDLSEWSSLLALSVIAMVDEEYNVSLKGKDIQNSTTIQDIFNAVQAQK